MILNWLVSRTVRQATAMRRHVQKLLNHQRDILLPQAVESVQASIDNLKGAVESGADKAELETGMRGLEQTANKWLKPYPHAAWRENVEVLLVALAIAMGIRTFFIQPFKIPTGSMQPTLYGVTSVPDYGRGAIMDAYNPPKVEIPTGWQRVEEWFQGTSYLVIRAPADGPVQQVSPPFRFLIFNIFQTIRIGDVTKRIWFPPDYGASSLEARAGLNSERTYRKGDEVVRMKISAGDHLFVDRLTYNFRAPKRGEIIVFETKGIPEPYRDWLHIPGDQFYIKRLVGLGGERIEIEEKERRVVVDGKEVTASMPHFEKLYSFSLKEPPQDSRYSGHVGGALAPFFQRSGGAVEVPPGHFVVMGDNTVNSQDSRYWGYFPQKHVIGKAFFVYWPITDRFGWDYHR